VWQGSCPLTRGSSRAREFARVTRSTETKKSKARFAASCWATNFFAERGRRSHCSRHEPLRRFLSDLPPEDYYADADAAFDALRRRAQFNVIDMATAWKADLIVRKARPFSVEEMRRRVEGNLLGAQVFVASPEDTLIAKLEWAQQGGGSQLQLRDVLWLPLDAVVV